ncbi:MAG: 50S ribosomal protein L17 [Alphaproteobacteria bacterium]
MRHGVSGRKFNRTGPHRQRMLANMSTSLLRYEQLVTTLPKAKSLRGEVERLITLAKRGDLASRRRAARVVRDDEVLRKLFDVLGSRYAERPGGYTRVLRAGYRYGDDAPRAVIELVDRDPDAKPRGSDTEDGDEPSQP